MTLAAVIFDWGGTLTPWHPIEPGAAWLAAVGDAETAERLQAAEQEVWVRARDEHRSGTLPEIFAAAGVPHDRADADRVQPLVGTAHLPRPRRPRRCSTRCTTAA